MRVVVQMIGITMEWGVWEIIEWKKHVKTWPDVPCLSSDNCKRELKATHIGRWLEYTASTWVVYNVDRTTFELIGTSVILEDSKVDLRFIYRHYMSSHSIGDIFWVFIDKLYTPLCYIEH